MDVEFCQLLFLFLDDHMLFILYFYFISVFSHAKINATKIVHIYVNLLWKNKHLNRHIAIQL